MVMLSFTWYFVGKLVSSLFPQVFTALPFYDVDLGTTTLGKLHNLAMDPSMKQRSLLPLRAHKLSMPWQLKKAWRQLRPRLRWVTSVRAGGADEDPWTVLGVPRNSNLDDIKTAYRKLALKLHPDVNDAPGATAAFAKLSKAYQMLLDSPDASPRPFRISSKQDLDHGFHLDRDGRTQEAIDFFKNSLWDHDIPFNDIQRAVWKWYDRADIKVRSALLTGLLMSFPWRISSEQDVRFWLDIQRTGLISTKWLLNVTGFERMSLNTIALAIDWPGQMDAVAAALPSHTSLHTLYLESETIWFSSYKSFHGVDPVKGLPALTALAEAVGSSTSLHTLHLSCQFSGYKAHMAVGGMLESMTSLRNLSLDMQGINKDGIYTILSAIIDYLTELQTLHLKFKSSVSINDEITEAFAELATETSLTWLSIELSHITIKGAKELAKALESTSVSQTFHLKFLKDISPKSVDAFDQALRSSTVRNFTLTASSKLLLQRPLRRKPQPKRGARKPQPKRGPKRGAARLPEQTSNFATLNSSV